MGDPFLEKLRGAPAAAAETADPFLAKLRSRGAAPRTVAEPSDVAPQLSDRIADALGGAPRSSPTAAPRSPVAPLGTVPVPPIRGTDGPPVFATPARPLRVTEPGAQLDVGKPLSPDAQRFLAMDEAARRSAEVRAGRDALTTVGQPFVDTWRGAGEAIVGSNDLIGRGLDAVVRGIQLVPADPLRGVKQALRGTGDVALGSGGAVLALPGAAYAEALEGVGGPALVRDPVAPDAGILERLGHAGRQAASLPVTGFHETAEGLSATSRALERGTGLPVGVSTEDAERALALAPFARGVPSAAARLPAAADAALTRAVARELPVPEAPAPRYAPARMAGTFDTPAGRVEYAAGPAETLGLRVGGSPPTDAKRAALATRELRRAVDRAPAPEFIETRPVLAERPSLADAGPTGATTPTGTRFEAAQDVPRPATPRPSATLEGQTVRAKLPPRAPTTGTASLRPTPEERAQSGRPAPATVPPPRVPAAPEPVPAPPAATVATPETPLRPAAEAGEVGKFPVEQIRVDPKRFQFKEANERGETGRLRDVQRPEDWRESSEGVVTVWRDPADGQVYATDGHQRVAAAQRVGREEITVRFSRAKSAEEARIEAAATNLRADSAEAADAGRFYRELRAAGVDPEVYAREERIPVTSRNAAKGRHLAKLSDELWERYRVGELPEPRAVEIGKSGLADAQQRALFDVLAADRTIPPEEIPGLARRIRAASVVEGGDQGALFAGAALDRSLFRLESRLETGLLRDMSQDRRVFGQAAKHANELQRVGSIDRAAAAGIAEQSNTLHGMARRLLEQEGRTALHEAISETARQVDAGVLSESEARARLRQRTVEVLNEDPLTRNLLRDTPAPAAAAPEPVSLFGSPTPPTYDAPSPVIGLSRGQKISQASVPAPKEPVRLSAIVETLSSVIERPVRYGRLGKRPEVQGFWRVKEEVVRTRYPNDVAVTAHEIGHGMEKLAGVELASAPPAVRTELDGLGRALYGAKRPNGGYAREGWAEAVRSYVQAEPLPSATEAFLRDVLERHPAMRERLDRARQMAAEYEAQGPEGRVAAFEHTDRASLRKSVEKVVRAIRNFTPGTTEFRQRFVTSIEPVEAMERAAGATTVSQNAGRASGPSAYAAAANGTAPMKARAFVTEGTLGTEVGKSLADILAPVVKPTGWWTLVDQERLQAFRALVNARRAKDYAAKGLEFGMRPSDVEFILAKHGGDPVLLRAAEEFTAFQNRLFDHVLDALGVGPERRAAIREANPNYTHWDRVFLDEEGAHGPPGRGRGIGSVADPIRARTGSTREIRDVVETTIRDAERLIAVADRLRAQRAIIEFAETQPGMGRFVERLPKDRVPTKFTLGEIAKEIEAATGMKLDPVAAAEEATIWRASRRVPHEDNVVSLWRDGQQVWYQLDPRLFRSTMGMGADSLVPAAQLATLLSRTPLGWAARGVRLGATGVNVGFNLANVFKDFLTFAVMGRSPRRYAAGVRETFRPSEVRRLYEASGAEASTFAGADRAAPAAIADRLLAGTTKRGKVVNVLRHPVDALRALSSSLESIPRLAEFQAHLEAQGWKRGGPPPTPEIVMRAANAAADVTVDFRRAGEWGRAVNAITAFFNPAVQGLDKSVRAVRENPGSVTRRFATFVGLPTLVLWWHNREDPEYAELPDYLRKGFWNVKVGGEWYRVPKPPTLGVAANLLEDAAEASLAEGSFPESLRDTLREAWKTETPPLVPNAVQITADVLRNRASFTKRPLVPRRLEDVSPEEQYTEANSEAAKLVGRTLGVSPAEVDYVAEQATGGLARDVVRTAESVLGVGEDTAAFKKPPVLGRFMSTGIESDDFERFWELKKELDRRRADWALRRREPFRGDAGPEIPAAVLSDLDRAGSLLTSLRRSYFQEKDAAKRRELATRFKALAKSARERAQSAADVVGAAPSPVGR